MACKGPILEEEFKRDMDLMKEYILNAKGRIRGKRDDEYSEKKEKEKTKNEAFEFRIKNVKRQIPELEDHCSADVISFTENELLERNTNSPKIEKKSEKFEEKLAEMLTIKFLSVKQEKELSDLQKRYDGLVHAKNKYVTLVRELIEEKELDKENCLKNPSSISN